MEYFERFGSLEPPRPFGVSYKEHEKAIEEAIRSGRAIVTAYRKPKEDEHETDSGFVFGFEGDDFSDCVEIEIYKNNERGSLDN